MSGNKTVRTTASVADYIASVEPPLRRAESQTLLDMMGRVTGFEPAMWGPSIVGFGEYHYNYASGRQGDFFLTGFAPRKSAMTVYIMPGFKKFPDLMARLGKFKNSVSCLYLTKLANADLSVLEELVARSVADMKTIYPQWKA